MPPEMLNTRSAAELLGVDKRTVLRLARAGKICSFRTPGGQHRFRRADVENLAAGNGSVSMSQPLASMVQNKRDEVEGINLEVQARRAKRELARLEAEEDEAERQRAAARCTESVAQRRALAELRDRRIREKQEREAARQREVAEQERRAWEAKIVADAAARLPHDLPADEKAVAVELVRGELASFGPEDSPQVVALAVSAATSRALGPWRRRKEIQKAIEESERALPVTARFLGFGSASEWQVRYRAAANAAIRALPADATIDEMRAALQAQATKVGAEFKRVHAQERHREACQGILVYLPLQVLTEDCEAARQTVENALAKLPSGSSEAELERAADRAISPYHKRKEVTQRAGLYLPHIWAYVEKLGAPDGEWNLGDYFERRTLAQQLEKKIRPRLLEAMLADEIESQEEAEDFIEDAVDSELENEE